MFGSSRAGCAVDSQFLKPCLYNIWKLPYFSLTAKYILNQILSYFQVYATCVSNAQNLRWSLALPCISVPFRLCFPGNWSGQLFKYYSFYYKGVSGNCVLCTSLAVQGWLYNWKFASSRLGSRLGKLVGLNHARWVILTERTQSTVKWREGIWQ